MMFKNTSEDSKLFAIFMLVLALITVVGLITASVSAGKKESQLCTIEKLVVINAKIYCEISTKKVTEK